MKILVATKQTQGYRKSDVCYAEEDEPIIRNFKWDEFSCEYYYCGMTTLKGTTIIKVAESSLTRYQFINRYIEAIIDGSGSVCQDFCELFQQATDLLILASQFNVGEIFDSYDGMYILRRPAYSHPTFRPISNFSKIFSTNTTLTQLTLSYDNFTEKDVNFIRAEAARMGRCNVKWLLSSKDSDHHAEDLFESFDLDERYTNIPLATMIRDVNRVDFNFSYHKYHRYEKAIIQAAFLNHRIFQSLNLNTLEMGAKLGQSLADYLSGNSCLVNLELRDTKIPMDIIQKIIQALFTNTTLTTLDLSKNKLTAAEGYEIAELLKVNSTLTSLDLSDNYLNSAGGDILTALCFNSTLTSLNLFRTVRIHTVDADEIESSNALKDEWGDPLEPCRDPWLDEFSFPEFFPIISPDKPFDMGNPVLSYVKELWTQEHETMSIRIWGPCIDLDLLKAFLKHTPLPFMAKPSGHTLLHTAAHFGEIEAMQLLIEAGHPVHVATGSALTPLHLAAKTGQVEAMKLLIQHGHPIFVKDQSGQTAISYVPLGDKAAIAMLVQHGHPPLFEYSEPSCSSIQAAASMIRNKYK